MLINGTWYDSPSSICNTIKKYFYGLFNKPQTPRFNLNWDLLLPSKIPQPLALESHKSNTFSLPGDKSPGLDGFPLYFYHHYWHILKGDLLDLFQFFYQANNIDTLLSINQTFIALIPKKYKAEKIQDFRPISLLNSNYKIISKCLAFRLSPVLNFLLDDS